MLPVDHAYEGDIPEQREITALAQELQRREKGTSEHLMKDEDEDENEEKVVGFLPCCGKASHKLKSKIVHLCPPL